MNSNIPLPTSRTTFRGRFVIANYRDPEIEFHRGNPFIEALPPIWSFDDVASKFERNIDFKEEHRSIRPELRLHYVQEVIRFFQPLGVHMDLEQRFSRMIRAGYVDRNPMSPRFARDVRERISIDFDWRFIQEDVEGAEAISFNDSQWRQLDVPHDWSIEGSYDENNPAAASVSVTIETDSIDSNHSERDKHLRF